MKLDYHNNWKIQDEHGWRYVKAFNREQIYGMFWMWELIVVGGNKRCQICLIEVDLPGQGINLNV